MLNYLSNIFKTLNLLSPVLFLLFALQSQIASSQNMNFQWAKQIGDSSSVSRQCHCTDNLGNLYISGSFSGTLDVNPGLGVYTLTTNASEDIFITKLDPSGNFLWAKQIGGTFGELVNSIKTDANGNVIISGGFLSSSVDFDPGPGTFILNNASAGQIDVFILKLDAAGNFLWAKQLSSVTNENTYGMTVDGSNNVYITGYTTMVLDYDPGPGTYTVQSTGSYNIFVLKLDGSGNFIWAAQTNSLSTSFPTDIAVDNSGNVYAVGYFDGVGDFDPSPANYTLASAGSADGYLLKLSSSGSFLWAKQIGGTGYDVFNSIATNNSGDVFLTGFYSNTVDFDPGPAVFTATSNGGSDIFLCKLDANGNFGWSKTFGGIDNDLAGGITIDANSNLYVSGEFKNTLDIDPGPANYPVTSVGNSDIFISKFNASGTQIWSKQFGGSYIDYSPKLCLDISGNLYCSGLFLDKVDFDPGPLTSTMSTNGTNIVSIFLSKFSSCAAPINPFNTNNTNNLTLCSGKNTTLSAIGTGSINWYAPSYSVISVGNNLVTPSLTAGTYTYYAENDSLCSSLQRAVIVVTVNPRPSISLDGISSMCIGSSVTQSLSGAASYTWNTGSNSNIQVFTPSVSTTYSVVGTNSFGCTNSIVKTITVNPLPVITVLGNTFICIGTPLKQEVNGVSTFTWSTSAGIYTTNAGAISSTLLIVLTL
jgi:hypothetical protein